MDPFTLIFVGGLCLAAFALTISVRRDILTKERRRREAQRAAQPTRPRRKP